MPQNICGNCFSAMKGNKCPHCGYTREQTYREHDILSVGTVLMNRYVVGKLLGRGGFGITYLAYDTKAERAVAVKEYYPDGTAVRTDDNVTVEPMTSLQHDDYSHGLERFFSEAEIIKQFNGVNDIPEVYDVFRENGTAYYVMEFFSGISLNEYAKKHGKLTPGQAVYILKRLLSALSEIHASGVLHRDISPDNIIICRDGRIRLIDFGSARSFKTDETGNMSVIIKEGFAPAEQYWRKGSQDARTDLYSLGTSVYFGLTGEVPENAMIRMDDDAPFTAGIKKLPPALGEIIKKASDAKKDNRYDSAEEMLGCVEACGIDEEPVTLNADEMPKEVKRKARLRRSKSSLALIMSTAAVVLAALAMFFAFKMKNEVVSVKVGSEFYPVDLERLEITDQELTNSQIANLRHFKNLKYLNLENNYITDLSCLAGLENLESIHFNNNNVSDLSFVKNMHHLKKISGENNSISDISVLSDKTELEEVFFGDNYVTDISPLKNCGKLVKAGFNEAQIGNIDALAHKPNLIMVCLAGCNLKTIEPLSDCKSLRFVYLGRNDLTDLSPLKGCTIFEFYIDNNRLSGHTDTFEGITLNGFVCMEGNGFTEAEIQDIIDRMDGYFTVYY